MEVAAQVKYRSSSQLLERAVGVICAKAMD